jgi:nudix-type nucleoside diphosphatase (YffH/AdpP family)
MGGEPLEMTVSAREGLPVFLHGVLRHPELLQAVIGRAPVIKAASALQVRALRNDGATNALLVPSDGRTEGLVAGDLSREERLRLEQFHGAAPSAVGVTVAPGTAAQALAFVSEAAGSADAPAFDLAQWEGQWAATAVLAARDFARLAGTVPDSILRRRYPQMLTRAGARLRAGQGGPAGLRRRAGSGDVEEARMRQPYASYFAVEEFDLRFRRFDGRMSEELTRAVFISGDAAVVLPYDPRRDRVLVIEQWRAGPHARGDREPWLIEAVAGRIDGGETPEQAARREAREEAGLEVGDLHAAGDYYPSPAAKGEYIYSFVGIADLPDDAAGLGGLPGEGEDIRAHVISFGRLLDLVASGEINNAPLVILAYWLDRNRPGLRAAAGIGTAAGSGA